jgi:hypothetical protein
MPERISERKLDGDLQQFTIGLKPNFGDINVHLATLYVWPVSIELPPAHRVDGGDDRNVEGGHGRHADGGEDHQDSAATPDTGTLRSAQHCGWWTPLAVFVSNFNGINIDLVEYHSVRANCGGSS